MFFVCAWLFAAPENEASATAGDASEPSVSNEPRAALPPADCVRLQRQARLAWQQSQRTEALAHLEQADEVCPDTIATILARLGLRRLMNDQEGATRDLKALRTLFGEADQELPVAVVARAILDPSATEDELRLIRDRLRAYHSRFPDDQDLLTVLAVLEAQLGNLEESRKILGELLVVSGSPKIRWAVVLLDLELKRPEDTVHNLNILAQEDSAFSSWAELELLRKYAELGRHDDVARLTDTMLSQGIARQSLIAEAVMDAAWSLLDKNERAAARLLFERVLEIDPTNNEASETLRVLFGSLAEREEHRAAEDRRLDEEEDPYALLDEGTNRLASGDAAGALLLLSRAAIALPDQPIAWYNYGMAAIKVEAWKQACEALAKANQLEPGQPGTLLNLGIAFAKAERYQESISVLEELATAHPELHNAQYYLSICYRQTDDSERASMAMERFNQGKNGS